MYLAISTNALRLYCPRHPSQLSVFVTPLKRISPLCTLVGAVPGAHRVDRWAARVGHLDPAAWVIFGIVFFWHSLISCPSRGCIAKTTRAQASRPCPRAAQRPLLSFSAYWPPFPFRRWLSFLHFAVIGIVYFAGALVLWRRLSLLQRTLRLQRSIVCARQLLFASILYLPCYLLARVGQEMNAKRKGLKGAAMTMLIQSNSESTPLALCFRLSNLLSPMPKTSNHSNSFATMLGLNEDQIATIRNGKAICQGHRVSHGG